MPLDPQVAAHYAAQRATGDITQPISIEEIRANADRIYNDKSRSPQVFDVQDTVIPGPCGGVPVRIYTPGERMDIQYSSISTAAALSCITSQATTPSADSFARCAAAWW